MQRGLIPVCSAKRPDGSIRRVAILRRHGFWGALMASIEHRRDSPFVNRPLIDLLRGDVFSRKGDGVCRQDEHDER